MKLFGEQRIEALFDNYNNKVSNSVGELNDSSILKSDTNTLAQNLYKSHQIDTTLNIQVKQPQISISMEDIPITHLPVEQRLFATKKTYKVAFVCYEFKIIGNKRLLEYQPQKHINWTYDGNIGYDTLSVVIPTKYARPKLSPEVEKDVANRIKIVMERIQTLLGNVIEECLMYNSNKLLGNIISEIERRKLEIRENNNAKNRLNPF